MSAFDLIIRGGMVATPGGVLRADLGIIEGKIAELAQELAGSAREEIEAQGLHILPGVIDAHVHFNEPGRTQWGGFHSGSRALTAGGGTLFFDMPLNAHPPTTDAASFQLKWAAAESQSLVDFAFWGGLVPGNLERLGELAECGVVGFKAFMANSGIEDFPCVEDGTLRAGMKRAASLGLPVAVHAESEAMTRQLAQERINAGRTSIRDYLDSRPVAAELDAIRRALEMAGDTGCSLHVVHVSCGAGIRLIAEARRAGVNVSCETCPHYLTLTEEDVETIGAAAKCAPPLRSAREREELWQALLAGDIDTVGSDHSPAPPELKLSANFFEVWGGISGAQHTLPLLLTEGHCQRKAELLLLTGLLSSRVARRFQLPATIGAITIGAEANLVLVDLERSFTVTREDLLYRHPQTPYLGRSLRGQVVRTLLRGVTVFRDGKPLSKPFGRFVRPDL
jgi:allantoinase